MSVSAPIDVLPGSVRRREDVPAPTAYVVFDCETTGTAPGRDEIVSLAVVRLNASGIETARFAQLIRPSCPIPAEATAVHGISDDDVASAPSFAAVAPDLLRLLDGGVFVAHNALFDLGMLEHAFLGAAIAYCPVGVVCTLDAFRLVEPLAPDHRLESVCERWGIVLADAHDALNDVLATVALLRVLLDRGIAPETVELDHSAFLRLRSRGDTRPASERQIRRVFGLARSAGLVDPDRGIDRGRVVALVERVSGTCDIDSLSREQVQDVYDALEGLIAALPATRAA